jgi:hypothetical protein
VPPCETSNAGGTGLAQRHSGMSCGGLSGGDFLLATDDPMKVILENHIPLDQSKAAVWINRCWQSTIAAFAFSATVALESFSLGLG